MDTRNGGTPRTLSDNNPSRKPSASQGEQDDPKGNQQNKDNTQERLTSDKRYVTLVGHPWYGQQVRVVTYRGRQQERYGLVEDPAHPGFHASLLERWLSTRQPPPQRQPTPVGQPVCLSLSALDKMVQLILNQNQFWRATIDDTQQQSCAGPDLGTTSPPAQSTTGPTAFLPGPESSGGKTG